MADNLKDVWDRIFAWFKEHVPDNRLKPGKRVGARELASAERAIGVSFPPDLRASYSLMDGNRTMSVFPHGMNLMPLAEIVDKCQRVADRVEFEPPPRKPALRGVRQNAFWNVAWIPFTDSGDCFHHCVDMDPAPSGTVGQVILYSFEDGVHELEGKSFTAWLTHYAQALEEDRYHFDFEEGSIYPRE